MGQTDWLGNLDVALERIAAAATGEAEIRVMRGGARLALGLPRDRSAARVVLALYQPSRLKGRLFRLAAKGLVGSGLHRLALTPSGSQAGVPAVEWLREAAAAGRVGFLGCNPSHGLRCIVGGLLENGELFVAKLGCGSSKEAIVGEAGVLGRLAARNYRGVLKALALDTGDDWALLRLPHLGDRAPRVMADPAVPELLHGWLGDGLEPLEAIEWAEDLLLRAEAAGADGSWCAAMRHREVKPSLLHGDFAVWNLRLLPEGPCAIDWEWAVEDGVGGVDLAYGLRQEAVLVRRLAPERAVSHILQEVRQEALAGYLAACGWEGAHEDWLRFGLLHTHLNINSDCGGMLEALGVGLGR